MGTRLKLGDIIVDVVLKDIKNIHLSVYPPSGRVRVSAPRHMEMNTIRVFVISRLGWIKKQRRELQAQERETRRDFLNRESHYAWGQRYLLKIAEESAPPSVELTADTMRLTVRPGTSSLKMEAILDSWYRQELKKTLLPLIAKWEPLMRVRVNNFFIRRMKTKWGSCNPAAGHIRLNTELAKKPPECLEYVTVHELVHLLEPTHNDRFKALMDRFMPQWRECRAHLNELPLGAENWAL